MKLYSVEISGNLLSESLLESLCEENTRHKLATPESFRWFKNDNVDTKAAHENKIAITYENLVARWDMLYPEFEKFSISDFREKWLKYFFSHFGYDLMFQKADATADSGNKFPLSHRGWDGQQAPVVHTVLFNQELDKKSNDGRHKYSPHDTVQRFLNQTDSDLWAIVTNGRELRIVRDFYHETRKAYIKFDLEAIFDGRNFNDFRLLYRLIHPSRFVSKKENKEKCILEILFEESQAAGIAVGEDLRGNIRFAIESLANGFLTKTSGLVQKLSNNDEANKKFHHELLRIIYRLLFLLYAEQRNLMPGRSSLYAQEYSISALREKILSGVNTYEDNLTDFWEGLKVTFNMVYKGVPEMGIPSYNGLLFSPAEIPMLDQSHCQNDFLLETIKYLTTIEKGGVLHKISYIELGVDEIGSIYESLLEYIPRVSSEVVSFEDEVRIGGKNKNQLREIPEHTFFLDPRGTTRKTTGSYYTNPELVNALIESALEPVLNKKLEDAGNNKDARAKALLSLKVCDPACGSAAFLIAATEYLGLKLAQIKVNDEYPADKDIRHARREVLRHCIYGVDINPLSVELAKVSLWLTAATDDQPLNFLDHKIKCGNSLVGATPDLLKKNIPPEAYTAVEGDIKQVASLRIKSAKEYYKNKDQLTFETSLIDGALVITASDLSDRFNENNSAELQNLKDEYSKTRNEADFIRKNMIADYWASAFFWEHKNKREDYPRPEILDSLIKDNSFDIDSVLKNKINTMAERNQFFHWHLEFPEVFNNGGFDCVLGNPPFLGGLKISGSNGDEIRKYLTINYKPFSGMADLCSAFLRLSYNVIKKEKYLGMVSTNSIGQGDTRLAGLAEIIKNGGNITFARRFIKWLGAANVEVNLVTIHKGIWNGTRLLDDKKVNFISSRLDEESENESKQLKQNDKKSFQGDIIRGIGFVIEEDEALNLLSKNAENKNCILPYINGEDFNKSYEQKFSRYVICFHDWPFSKAQNYQELLSIIEKRVKPERDKVKQDKDRKNWWLFGAYRQELREYTNSFSKVLVRSRISEMNMFAFADRNFIFADTAIIFAFDDYYHFALLQSNVHEAWVRKNASTMRTDVRYTPTDCFETFPFPQALTVEAGKLAEQCGKEYYAHRQEVMRTRKLGLTKIYNLFNNPDCKDYDIVKMRELHAIMDNSILVCYGWEDIDFKQDFYKNDRGQTRFTISQETRTILLRRLLALNLEVAAKES